MLAWEVTEPAPIDTHPLTLGERPDPDPGPGQIRLRVSACGVCRTDLHVTEGDLPVHRPRVVPGHEVVGRVEAQGPGAERFAVGDRVGAAWLGRTCGRCRFCRRGDENLCTDAVFTGWDLDGGYAEAMVVDERFAYRLAEELSDDQVAPLLCAGIIGYRALRAARLPPGGRLGLYGFGGSAHLTAQVRAGRGSRALRGHPSEPNRADWRPISVPPGPGAPPRPHPDRSTRRSCSPRPASSCCRRSPRWTGAACWSWRGSTSPTYLR